MPISGCHDLPLATFNLPSRVFRHGCRRAECPKRRWGGFFHTLSCRSRGEGGSGSGRKIFFCGGILRYNWDFPSRISHFLILNSCGGEI